MRSLVISILTSKIMRISLQRLFLALLAAALPLAHAVVPCFAEVEPKPGSGHMVCFPEGQDDPMHLPLKHTDVRANITGIVSTV